MRNFFFIILISLIYLKVYCKTYEIAVIPKGSTHEFWVEVEKGAMKASKEFNVNVTYRGPKTDGDTDSQIKLVELFINKKVDAIVLAPNHKSDLVPIVKTAIEKGIVVVIIDSDLEGNLYDSFVATDNYKAGRLAGEKMLSLIGNTGSVGILRYRLDNSSTELREAGFLSVMKENNIKVIIDEYGGVTTGTSYRKAFDILKTNNNVNGFFTPNESSTVGVAKVIKELMLYKKINLIGFDLSPEIKHGIVDGVIKGVVVQQPELMGYLGVKQALDILNGKKVEKAVVVEVNFETK